MSQNSCDDPLFLHSRREALLILIVWGAAFAWVIPVSWMLGANRPAGEEISIVLGLPAWVFWGVALPWCIATVVSIWIALFVIADDNLGVAAHSGGLTDAISPQPDGDA